MKFSYVRIDFYFSTAWIPKLPANETLSDAPAKNRPQRLAPGALAPTSLRMSFVRLSFLDFGFVS